MNFYITFFTNLSILITCAYLSNILYKNFLNRTSSIMKNSLLIVTFILSGWLAMMVGVELGKGPVFDLRSVPIIFATLIFRNPRHVLIIGLGISASRYFVNGITPNSLTGSINIAIMGLVAAGLVILYEQRPLWSYRMKATISLLTINVVQVTGIAIFGALSREFYLKEIMPYTLPLSILLGAFFLFIINDFYKEQLRSDELRNNNLLLMEQTKELEDKAIQIMKSSKYKSDFLSNMSHELRTPLNSIIVLSELIRENTASKEHNENFEYADMINSSSNELLRTINDILDLSKMEAGKMDINWGEVSVEDVTELVYHEFFQMAEKKQLSFEVIIEEEAPQMLVSDGQRLSQIIRNLLNNAIKFTDQGGVTLRVYKDQLTDCIVFAVKDTGIGIDEENQQRVFDTFSQEDSTIQRKYEGTGLGL
ncbi:sensor histidine kinase [Bacillus sp. FJAT-28004]|uniref:ATP-binding protein n=1 Tax=Bacillus sp. FJAT-28004 TaxID=1679165 RepID=UPI0006B5E23F|nr:histidine kinase dimerization/phospho-acceptor domain-containing protein [Bacillus sp. FJAT-28004]